MSKCTGLLQRNKPVQQKLLYFFKISKKSTVAKS